MMCKDIKSIIALITYDYRKCYHKNLSIKKLQALLYLSQGIALAVYKKPLFIDDIIATDQYGYIVPSVNEMYRGHVTVANHKSLIRKHKKFIKQAYWCINHRDDHTEIGKIANVVFCTMGNFSDWDATELEDRMLSHKNSPLDRILSNYNPYLEDYSDYSFVVPKRAIRIWFELHVVNIPTNKKRL